MNIAIIGAGQVGGALGRNWARAGHRIHYGVREPQAEKHRALLDATGGAAVAVSPAEAARAAEIVVFATPWAATEEAVRSAGDLAGRVVIDCTNPLRFTPGVGLELALGHTDSGGEQVARWAAGARVVKAFNSYGWENFADARYPGYGELRPVMFLCGDEAAAKLAVTSLAEAIGFEPLDLGSLSKARQLEPLALLWIQLAMSGARDPHFVWSVLRRAAPTRL